MSAPAGEYDIFLSHTEADKPWVVILKAALEALGLRVWLDKDENRAGDNWVLRLSDGLQTSRYMVLVLSDHTADGRPWVTQEWTMLASELFTTGNFFGFFLRMLNLVEREK